MYLTGLLLFGVVDTFAGVCNVTRIDMIKDVELQSPDNISGILDIARLLETLERNRLRVIDTIETADNDESGIGVALKFFELTNGVIDTEFGGFARSGDDLKVV